MADIFDNLTPGVYYSDIPKKYTGGIVSRFVRESIASKKKYIISMSEEQVAIGGGDYLGMPALLPSGLSLEEFIGSEVRGREHYDADDGGDYYRVEQIIDADRYVEHPYYTVYSKNNAYLYFHETGLFAFKYVFEDCVPAGMTVEEFGQKLYEYLTMNPEDAPETLEIWVDVTEDSTTGAMDIRARFSVSADDILSDKPAVAKIHYTVNDEVHTNGVAIDTVDADNRPFYIPVLEPVNGQASSVGLTFITGDDGTVYSLSYTFGSSSRTLVPSDASRTVWTYTSENGSGEN